MEVRKLVILFCILLSVLPICYSVQYIFDDYDFLNEFNIYNVTNFTAQNVYSGGVKLINIGNCSSIGSCSNVVYDNSTVIRNTNTSWITSNQNNFGNCSVTGSCSSVAYMNYANTGLLNISGNIILPTIDSYIKIGNINPIITKNRLIASGSVVSHSGFSGKNNGWVPYFKMFSSTSSKIKEGNDGEYIDTTDIFCDYEADNFAESDATRPTKALTLLNGTCQGAVAEINSFINSSCVSLEKNPGWDTDCSNIKWNIKTGLKVNFNDGESYKFVVGNDKESLFKIGISNGTGVRGAYIYDVVGADNHKAVDIEQDMNGYNTIAESIYMYSSKELIDKKLIMLSMIGDASNMNSSDGTFIDMAVVGAPLASGGHIDGIHMHHSLDHLIHVGSADTLNSAYVENVNQTANFTTGGAGATLFENDNDYVYIGNTNNFTIISFSLATTSSRNINAEYYYCDNEGTWQTLGTVTDTTNGMRSSGTITFTNPSDRGKCNKEYDGTPFSDTTNYTYIAIKRTRNRISTEPVEDLISIGGSTDYFILQKDMLRLDGSVGGPEVCTAKIVGAIYYDKSGVQLLWCDGTGWQPFAMAGDVTVHNSLSGLQGGQATEYYHLKSAEHSELTNWMDSVTLQTDGSTNIGGGNLTTADTVDTENLIIRNPPAECSDGYYMTKFNGSTSVCTRALKQNGDDATGNYNISTGNVSVGTGNKFCLDDGACNWSIQFNGSHILIGALG